MQLQLETFGDDFQQTVKKFLRFLGVKERDTLRRYTAQCTAKFDISKKSHAQLAKDPHITKSVDQSQREALRRLVVEIFQENYEYTRYRHLLGYSS